MAEVKDVNADMSTEDILESISKDDTQEDAENPADSSSENKQTDEDASEEQQDEQPASEGEKTQESENVDEEGKPIPYNRFKQVNETKKKLESELESMRKDREQFDELLSDPEVLKIVRKKQGYADEAINKELGELGHKPAEKQEFDLSTKEGWEKYIEHKIQERLDPINQNLSKAQFQQKLKEQTEDAKKLSEGVFNLPYGNESKADDPNTAVGKMLVYIQNHPEKKQLVQQGALTKADLLRLALSEEGFKRAESKGEKKEKARQEKLKSSAMESDANAQDNKMTREKLAEMSANEIFKWRQQNPDVNI